MNAIFFCFCIFYWFYSTIWGLSSANIIYSNNPKNMVLTDDWHQYHPNYTKIYEKCFSLLWTYYFILIYNVYGIRRVYNARQSNFNISFEFYNIISFIFVFDKDAGADRNDVRHLNSTAILWVLLLKIFSNCSSRLPIVNILLLYTAF